MQELIHGYPGNACDLLGHGIKGRYKKAAPVIQGIVQIRNKQFMHHGTSCRIIVYVASYSMTAVKSTSRAGRAQPAKWIYWKMTLNNI